MNTNNLTVNTSAVFIPQIWVNEVRAATESQLVIAKNTKIINHQGKKGDVLIIPNVSNLVANIKQPNTQVTLQAPTESSFTLALNIHREASFFIEDIVRIQSAYDLRSEYTHKAGYAIAQAMDSDLGNLYTSAAYAINGAGQPYSATAPNPAPLSSTGIRQAIQFLDQNNAPEDDRYMFISPLAKNELLSISQFTEYYLYGDKAPIQKGEFGDIFGLRVFMTTNLPNPNLVLVMHKEALVLAKQLAPRVQAQYMQEYLGTLVTVDTIYGVGVFRPYFMVAMYIQ